MVLGFLVIVSTFFMLTYKVHFWFGYLQKIKLCTWMTRWLEATLVGPRVNWYAHLLPVLSVLSHKVTWVIPSCFVHQLLGDLNGEISGLIPWTKKWLPVKKWKETKRGLHHGSKLWYWSLTRRVLRRLGFVVSAWY